MAQSSFQDTLDDMELTIDPGGKPLPTKPTLVEPGRQVKLTVIDGRLNRPFRNRDGGWSQTLNLTFSIDDKEISEELNLPEPRASMTVWLDIDQKWNGEGPAPLVYGKPNQNLNLGKVLDAFKLNDGRKVKLPSMFMHESCWGLTGRSTNDEDRYTPIAMLGIDEESVTRRSRR
jgi:hypothetical protein